MYYYKTRIEYRITGNLGGRILVNRKGKRLSNIKSTKFCYYVNQEMGANINLNLSAKIQNPGHSPKFCLSKIITVLQ